MSTPTEFDRELYDIYVSTVSNDLSLVDFKSTIKQAVDKYVIGEDGNYIPADLSQPALSGKSKNALRREQRQSLWEKK